MFVGPRLRRGKAEGDDTSFEVVRYNPHKDDTDLGLALAEVSRRWPGAALTATCFGGGNPDHLLGVLGRFAAWQGSVQLIEDGYEGRILHAGDAWCVAGAVGSRFSFIPLTPEAIVSEYHMRWELDHKHVGAPIRFRHLKRHRAQRRHHHLPLRHPGLLGIPLIRRDKPPSRTNARHNKGLPAKQGALPTSQL